MYYILYKGKCILVINNNQRRAVTAEAPEAMSMKFGQ